MTILFVFLVLAALTVGTGMVYQEFGKRRDSRRFPAPGRMVRSGGQEFHVFETGEGPSVVLEAGIASTSLAWAIVQPALSPNARVVSYDRAGFGWSPRARTARSLENAVADLYGVLQAAAIRPPYFLVAHSFGALIVRQFAAKHPELVAGMVLVDPVDTKEWCPLTEIQKRRLDTGVKLSRRGAALARLGVVRLALDLVMAGNRSVPKMIARWSAGRGSSVTERLTGEVRKLPVAVWPMIRMHWSHEKCFKTMAEYLALLPENARAASNVGWPKHIPVIVLTVAGAKPELPEYVEHRVAAKSGHWIQLDEPELVIDSVRDGLARAGALQSCGR